MYEMIKLKYNYKDLEPYYSSEMFNYHYNVLYKGYTDTLNKLLDEYKKDKIGNIQCLNKRFAFNCDAYILHSLFFSNLTPNKNTKLNSELTNHIIKDFESVENFNNLLKESLLNVEGSGWVVFGYNRYLDKLFITQVENHRNLILIDYIPLLVIDMWEHSYYLQYKTNKKDYVINILNIIDYNEVNERYNNIYIM